MECGFGFVARATDACRALVICLLLSAVPAAWAQNVAVNTATVTPPPGVVDPSGGCTGTPPVCTGNNTATDSDPIVTVSTTKTASPASGQQVAPGQVITYTLGVTVAGAATPRAIVLTDTLGAGLVPGAAPAGCSLAGQVMTCTLPVGAAVGSHQFVYTATVAATATGSVGNQVAVDAGTCASCTTTHPVAPATASLVKSSSPASGQTVLPNSSIGYTLTLSISGSYTTEPITITDTLSPGLTIATPPDNPICTVSGRTITCIVPAGTAPGTVTTSYTATVDNTATGTVGNSVTATNPAGGDPDPVCTTCSTQHPVNSVSELALTKTVTSTGPYALGSVISYSIVATNTGTVTLNNVVVSDPLLAAPNSTTCATVAPNATCTLTGSYTVQQSDVDAGQVVNTATADSNEADPVTASQTTPIAQSATLAVAKTVTSTGPYALGSVISYSIVATNTGTVTLNNVVVSDPLLAAPNSTTCATVAPNATCTLTGSYTVQQSDVDAGQVVNTATADSNEADPVTASQTTPIAQSATLAVAKTVTSTGPYALGSVISYSIVATNTGTVTLNNVVVSDPLLAAPNSTTCATVAPNATCTLTGSYTVQQSDVDAGQVVNTATADSNEADPVTASQTTPIAQSATLAVAKTVTSTGPYALGSVISYSIVATNTGTVTLNNVVVSDPLLAAPNSTTCATVAPNATCTLTGSYTVQQSDVDAGQVVNTATADSNEADPVTASQTTPIAQSATLAVAKTVTSTGPYALGSVISYSIVATNTGTVTLNNVVVSDPLLAAPNSTTCATVAPNATCTLTGSYTVQQSDVDAGQVVNTATADSNEADPVTASQTTPIAQSATLAVAKTVTSTGPYALGSVISYSIVATNTGTVTLNNVVVSDPLLAAPNSTTCATVAPNATCTLTGSYTVQQSDVDAGQVVNTATADSNETDPVTGTTTTPIAQSATLAVAKTVTSTGPYALGSVISYSIVATNTGTVTLNNVVVSDPLLAAPNSTTCATVAPNATCTLTGSYTVQQSDVDAGQVVNTATADSNEADPVTASQTTPIAQSATLAVAKTVTSTGPYALGSVISYSIVATNTGTVTLNNVVVSDPLLAAPNSTTCATVAPNATCTLTGSYTVQQSDVDAGQVVNTATADSNEADPVTASQTTPIAQSATLAVAKTVTSTGPYALGSVISYSIVATNTGTVTLNNVVVSDPLLAAPNSTTCATVAPNATCTLTGSYTVQQSDVDAGQVVNTATADSNEADPVTASQTTPIAQSATLAVAKTVTSTGPYALGSVISYSIVATNTGTVTLNNVVVSDPLLAAPNSTTCATVAPNATCTLTGSYTVQQSDVDAGQVVNTATADSNEADPVTASQTTPIAQSATLAVAKTVTSTGPYALGSVISYSIVATNTGTVTLNNVVVSDPLLAAPNSTTCATVAPNATCTLTGSYTVQQSDVDAGQVVNTATADSNEADPVTASQTTPIAQSATLAVAKTVTSTGPYALGSVISYSIVATNTGTVTLNNVVVSDPLLAAPNSTTCATVAPNATCTLTGSYTVQQSDVDAGQVVNTATADSNEADPVTASQTTPIAQSATLAVAKTVTSTGPYALGSVISYSIVATNTGTVTLNNVVVSDPLLAAPNSTTCATVAPNATCTLTGSYTVQQSDVDAGQVVNTATADSNEADPVTASQTTPIAQSATLAVAKTVTSTGPYALGSVISYSIVATNTGTVTLNNVVVSDPLLAAPNSTTCATVAPNATCTLTGSYTVQQSDVDAGQVVNTATADSNEADPVTASQTTPIAQSATLAVAKTVTSTGPYALGSVISYSIVATNTGTVTLNNVVVSDPLLAAPNSTTCATVAPNATCTLTGSYTVQQSDVDAGQVVNTATADSNEADPVTASQTTPIAQSATLAVAKTVTSTGPYALGSVISYSIVATNTGTVTLNNVVVSDPLLAAPNSTTCATVAPNATCTLTGSYTVQQSDVDAGQVVNTATADSNEADPVTASQTTPIAQSATLAVAKTVTSTGPYALGSVISYSIVATNTGTVTLNNVVVSDPLLAAPNSTTCATVAPNATCTLTGSYTVQQSDVDAGQVVNTATADSNETDPVTGTTTTPIAQSATLAVAKTVTSTGPYALGSVISYSIVATNTGTVTLNNVVVSDPLLAAPNSTTCATVAPNATCTLTGSYTVQQSDVDAGQVVNTATADSNEADPVTASQTTPIAQSATLAVAKTVTSTGPYALGSVISYSIVATNTGTVTLNNVVVSDPLLAAPNSTTCATVAPNATCTLTGSYTVQQSDVDAGQVVNTATADSNEADPVTASQTTPIAQSATLAVAKTVTSTGPYALGSVISYSIVATNTGTVTLNNVVVSDPLLAAPNSTTCATVAPNATCTLTGSYTVQQSDVDAGQVVNTATADSNEADPVTASQTTPIAQSATLAVAKTVTSTGPYALGSVISYSIVATNTGTVTLNNVVVSDPLLAAPNSTTCATVAPNATCTLTGSYTVQQSDVDAGQVVNTATADSNETDPVTGTTTTPIAQSATLAVAKRADTPVDVNGNGLTDAGDTISYSFTVTNTGTLTITNVAINDPMLSNAPLSCAAATLAPAASTTCGPVVYTITAADVEAGSVDNSATARGTTPSGDAVESGPSTTSTPTTGAGIATVVKTADPASGGEVAPGQVITYTLSTTVTGYALTQDLTLTDTLSANQTFGGVTSAGAYACSGELSCVLPAGTSPGTYAVTYIATVNADATGSVGNSVVVTNPAGGDPDPTCVSCTTTHPVVAPQIEVAKSSSPASGSFVMAGDSIGYTVTATVRNSATTDILVLTDTLSGQQSLSGPLPDGCSATATGLTCTLAAGSLPGTYVFAYTTTVDAGATGSIGNTVAATSGDEVGCTGCSTTHEVGRPAIGVTKAAALSVDNGTPGIGNVGDVITYTVTVTNTGNVPLSGIAVLDSFEGRPATTLDCAPATLAPGATATCAAYTHVITSDDVADGDGRVENVATASGLATGGNGQGVTVTASSSAVVEVERSEATVRVVKQAAPRDVKVGDLVRYTVRMENTGRVDVVDASLVDTPPAGFSYVDGSLTVVDRDGAGRLVGTYPIRVDRIDIAVGEAASITYLLRVGAGVRTGIHTNSAYVQDNGTTISNVATADVQLVGDPMLDESLIVGTVFDDRDGDGWQDSASMSGVRIQGGFAPGAYVAGSTTVDRGNGPAPEPDASAPLLHGIALGKLEGRQSNADPANARQVVVSQQLETLAFTDDFVLTTGEGVTLRMDAAGNTRLERSSDAAKGLTSAEPTVERRVSQVADGYRVDYVIGNAGIDERGIPGVRIASVEGLLVETDQFGRYHLVGVDGGAERGRNFILKVDPATLPPGSVFTTSNPLVRRVTPGVPTRFDFGVRMPTSVIEGGEGQTEIKLGEVMFDAGSADIPERHLPAIEEIARAVDRHGGAELVIAAQGEDELLAFERAISVRDAVLEKMSPGTRDKLKVSLRANPNDPRSTVVGVMEWPLLGTVLFDTDRAEIKPQFQPLIKQVADYLVEIGSTRVAVVGHADPRASDEYNMALGMRRAKAVFEAIAVHLPADVRKDLRVEYAPDQEGRP